LTNRVVICGLKADYRPLLTGRYIFADVRPLIEIA